MQMLRFLRLCKTLGVALALALLSASCGDVFRPVANPVAGPPGDPQLFHLEFVVNQNGPANPGTSLHIDVSGDSELAVLKVGIGPVHAAIQPPGQSRIFIANRDNDTVVSYTPSFVSVTPTTTTLPAGSRPVFLNSTQSNKMYVANSGTNTVAVIAGPSEVVAQSIPVGTNPVALAETPDGKKLYCVNQGDNTVSVVDTGTGTVTSTVAVGTSPVWALISPDGLAAYVANQGDGTMSVISTVTDTVSTTLPVGASPNYMFLQKNSNRLYVTNTGGNSVSVFNTTTTPPTPVATIPVAPGPMSVAVLPNGTRAYVGSVQLSGGRATAVVSVINTSSNAVETTIPLTSTAQVCDASVRFRVSVAVSSDNRRAYLANCDAGSTTAIDVATNKQVLQLMSPASASPPPSTGAQPPPQNPVFILSSQ
jgi:YVTN family beta-propeller protein